MHYINPNPLRSRWRRPRNRCRLSRRRHWRCFSPTGPISLLPSLCFYPFQCSVDFRLEVMRVDRLGRSLHACWGLDGFGRGSVGREDLFVMLGLEMHQLPGYQ